MQINDARLLVTLVIAFLIFSLDNGAKNSPKRRTFLSLDNNIQIFNEKSNSEKRRVTFILTLTDSFNAMFRASVSEQR